MLKGFTILDFDCNLSWDYGYTAAYVFRGIHIRNAILNYNNCVDIIMQIIFVAFGLYKVHPEYNRSIEFKKILSWCDYDYLSRIYSKNKNADFNELWKLLTSCWNSISPVRSLANQLKHQQNFEFEGEYIAPLLYMKIKKLDGTEIDFSHLEPLLVDLDQLIQDMKEIHCQLLSNFIKIIKFINYEKACCKQMDKGEVIPNENEYKKITISNDIVYPKKKITIYCIALVREKDKILVRVDNNEIILPEWCINYDASIEKTLEEKMRNEAGIICKEKKLKKILHIDKKREEEKTLVFCYEIKNFSICKKADSYNAHSYSFEIIEHNTKKISPYYKMCLDEVGKNDNLEEYYIKSKEKYKKYDNNVK